MKSKWVLGIVILADLFLLGSLNLLKAQPQIKKEDIKTSPKQYLGSQTALQRTQEDKTPLSLKANIRTKGKRIFLELNQNIKKAEVFSEGRKIGELGVAETGF